MARLILPIHSNRRGQAVQSRLVNCYAEQSAAGAKGPITLVGCPGVEQKGTLPETPFRGWGIMGGRLFAAAGNNIYQIFPDWTTRVVNMAGVTPFKPSGRVSFAENRDGLNVYTDTDDFFLDPSFGNPPGDLQYISDADKRISPAVVDVIEGYTVSIEKGSDRFYTSNLGDSTAFTATDFGTAASEPDELVTLLVDKARLILFGQSTLEMWFVGNAIGFPLARVPNGIAETGCIAAFSPVKMGEGMYFLDMDKVPRTLVGISPQKISSHAIDEEFRQITNPEDVVGFHYHSEGHQFYCLTTSRGTFIFDAQTGEWHERKSLGLDRWRVDDVAQAYNQQIAFDSESGAFGVIDESIGTEFGDPIRMDWAYPAVYAEGRTARHRRIEVSCTVGEAAAGVTPVIGLEISDDGGKTFTDVGSTRSLGETGEYFESPIWTKLGSSRNRVYRPYISDAVRRVIADTQLEVDGGRI